MIIWNGLGILVPIIAVACVFLVNSLASAAGVNTGPDPHGWPLGVGLLFAAALVSALGYFLNRRPGRVVIDKATGQEITLKSRASVFFIPVLYWGPILAVIGIFCFFSK